MRGRLCSIERINTFVEIKLFIFVLVLFSHISRFYGWNFVS
jgi:hypothetical protein